MNNKTDQLNHKIAEYFMNPFDFVPLPVKPIVLQDNDILGKKLYEGELTYSINVLTPVHISGKINSQDSGNNLRYNEKYFYRREKNEKCIIPGSSVRGMLTSFIEALTGSDFGVLTVGDEGGQGGKNPYSKNHGERNVGFKMQAADHPDVSKTNKSKFERNMTLPDGFGQRIHGDVARFMFGYVREDENDVAHKGRVLFEDIILNSSVKMVRKSVWDVKGKAPMGSPNPRANTAWYFTPGDKRKRSFSGRHFQIWEVLANKVRGRKFYFHQDPDQCFQYYQDHWNWMPLVTYSAESIKCEQKIESGKIYFTDIPLHLVKLIKFSLELTDESNLAHKLGGLKPFGFGSIQFNVSDIKYRAMNDVFSDWEHYSDKIKLEDLTASIIDHSAWKWLRRIMRVPDKEESKDYLFVYPPYNQRGQGPWAKGFAQPETVGGPGQPISGKSIKTTLFFDWYQKNAKNFDVVMGKSFSYSHTR